MSEQTNLNQEFKKTEWVLPQIVQNGKKFEEYKTLIKRRAKIECALSSVFVLFGIIFMFVPIFTLISNVPIYSSFLEMCRVMEVVGDSIYYYIVPCGAILIGCYTFGHSIYMLYKLMSDDNIQEMFSGHIVEVKDSMIFFGTNEYSDGFRWLILPAFLAFIVTQIVAFVKEGFIIGAPTLAIILFVLFTITLLILMFFSMYSKGRITKICKPITIELMGIMEFYNKQVIDAKSYGITDPVTIYRSYILNSQDKLKKYEEFNKKQ